MNNNFVGKQLAHAFALAKKSGIKTVVARIDGIKTNAIVPKFGKYVIFHVLNGIVKISLMHDNS